MSEKSGDLRFDVYERVHLPDDVAAIDELEEIELIPRIAVMDEGDQAILRGQLLLNGVYRSRDEGEGILALEHRIPVEISLPMHRVSRLDDISIDIDNFDVDILSARTLNVTGVLSLRGLLVDTEEESEWQEEVFTAVHEHQEEELEEEQFGAMREVYEEDATSSYTEELEEQEEWTAEAASESPAYIESEMREEQFLNPNAVEVEDASQTYTTYATFDEPNFDDAVNEVIAERYSEFTDEVSEEQVEISEVVAQHQSGWNLLGTEYARVEETDEEEQEGLVEEQWEAVHGQYEQEERVEEASEYVYEAEEEASSEGWQEYAEEEAVDADQEEREFVEEQYEEYAAPTAYTSPQIAFNAQTVEQTAEGMEVGIRSILGSSNRERALRESALQQEMQHYNQEEEKMLEQTRQDDEVEWQSMFLGREQEQSFRKIRMCIVQREETLEMIALRYNLTPRDLQNYNQLHDHDISEGQLLYIPASQVI